MAREVNGGTQGEARDYVPKAFDNRDDGSPITIKLKVPTERERRTLRLKGLKHIEDPAEMMTVHEEAVGSYVQGVTNYKVRGKTITNAKDLIEFGETEVITDIAMHIYSGEQVEEEEKKESGG